MNPHIPSQSSAMGNVSRRRFASFRFSAIFILCLVAVNVFAANKNWIGDVSSDWNDANNWQDNVVPGVANSGVIDPTNYTYAPIISSNSTHSMRKVIVQNGGVLTIQANLTITDDLEATGTNSRIDHSAGTLTISAGGKDVLVNAGGVYNLSGGILTFTGVLNLTNGTFNMSGSATLSIGTSLSLTASSANTSFNQTGGTTTIPTSIIYKATTTLSSTISVSGGTLTNSGNTSFTDSETDLTYLNVSGGTVTLTGTVADASGWIQITVSNTGHLKFQGALTMEASDLFNQTGGTVTFEGGNKTWTNAGTFNSTAGDVIFNDATVTNLSGAGTFNFYNIIINSAKVLTQNTATNINVRGNWTNSGGTFNEGTRKVTFTGTGDQTITGAETFYQLEISKSSGKVTLANNVIVSNTLTMTQGNIETGANKITLGTATTVLGTLTYTAGTIVGKFERWFNSTGGTARLFPVGTASSYRPATFTPTTIVGGSLIAEFIASDPGSSGLTLTEGGATVNNQFTEGYWDFTAANSLTSTNYRMDLTATGFTSYTLAAISRVIKRTNSGSAWTLQGTHVDVASSVASRTAFNGISTAQFGIGYVTCTAPTATITQTTTTDVWQGITNYEIIKIAVNSSAATCTENITQFNFTTAGTPGCSAASTDISNAKVYYTGTSATFATSTLYGSLGSAPNGAFAINGSQTITSNTVYFWLTYDISGTATANNLVDGQLVSYFMGGNTISGGSLTTPDPAGSRTVKGARYAVANGNWNATSTWSYSSGGAAGAAVPTSGTDVYIETGRTVTVNSTGAVGKNIYIQSGNAAKLVVTTGGSLTCSSITMTTTNKKAELWVQGTGSLTVNGNVSMDYTNLSENASTAFQVNNSAIATINGNLTLTNPTGSKAYIILNGTSLTTVTGNITLSGNAADRAYLGMGGTARLNVKGTLGIAASKYGQLYNTDALYTSIINFNGTSPQILEVNTSNGNTNEWLYSIVWISNPAGVTPNANIVDNGTRNSIRKALYVKSGILKTGGYSIALDNLATALFQVDDGATFYTTTTDAFGGIPDFGSADGNGKITLGTNSTVTFAGASQTIPILSGTKGSAYGNVNIAGTGTKTLGKPHHGNFRGTGGWDVEGNITVSNNVKLDVSATNYNITVGGNWVDQNTVAQNGFNQRSGTVTFDGNATQTITLSASPFTFYNLIVNKTGGTLNFSTADLIASNAFTMTVGNINTATRKLTLGTSTASVGTYARTSGTIIGKFERWLNSTGSKEFPVGTTAYYRPATINFSQITSGSMLVEFIASTASNTGLPVTESSVTVGTTNICTEGYWRCTAANSLASTNYNITLGINGFTSKIISSNTRVIKRANSGSNWTLDGTHVSTTATTAGRTACSGFSEFAVATVNCTPAVTASITVTTHACNNSGGALTLALTNAQAPISYTWSNGATTQNLSNLSSGNYTVTAIDFNNCSASATASVGVTAATMTVTHSTDEETPDGAIDLTVGGGTAPYTYLWNDLGADITTEDRTGLQPGWYSVTITDVSGCKNVKSAMVAYMDTIHAGSYIVDMGVLPQSIGNGLKPFGFVSDMIRNQHVPVSWSINPDKAQYGTDFEVDGKEYKGGPFIVEVEYIDNVIDNRIAYWESKGVVGDYTTTDVVVPVYAEITGFSNLGIDEQNENIVIPYFNNAEVPTSIYYVGLPSTLGNCDNAYILPHADPTWANHSNLKTFVQDGGYVWAGCHAVSMLEGIHAPGDTSDRMNFLSQTGLQCYSSGKCGSLITEVHGDPTAPYTYDNTLGAHPLMQIMGDLTPSTENGSEDLYIPLTTGAWNTGAYRAITTADGAPGREGVKLVFGSAFDDKDNGLVMYEAGHTAHNRGTTASIVAAQRTFFNFILHSGISKRLLATVTAPAAMSEGTGTTLDVEVTSGGAPFTYQWTTNVNGSFGSPNDSSTTFTITKGNGRPYARVTVAITDACGRVFYETKTIAVLYNGSPNVSWYNGYNISCNGGNDGSIMVQGVGGTPPYTYEWGHGPTTATVTDLSAGTYTVTITDAAPTQVYDTIEITEPPTYLHIDTVFSAGTILCYWDTTGSIDMTYSGGTAPYSILWSNGDYTEDITGLMTGTYDVTVTDMNGCYAQLDTPFSIGPDSLTITDTITHVACSGGSDGAISLTITGGTTPYTYSWSTGGSASSIAGISDGDYHVTVTDSNSCVKTDSFTVAQATALDLSTTPTHILCNGASTGVVDLSVSGGTPPYTYNWSSGETTQDISGKAAGGYTVTITDDNGCTGSTSRTLTQPAALIASLDITNITCFGDDDGVVDINVSGGVGPFTLYDEDGSMGAVPTTLTDLGPSNFQCWVIDANGCVSDTMDFLVIEPAQLASTLNVTDVSVHAGNDGEISQTVTGGTNPKLYSWTNGASTRDITSLIAGSYTVTITDFNGCTITRSATIDEPGACPCTWLGGTSNEWANGANWDCEFEPTDTCDVVIPAGTPNTCNVQSTAACKDLTINASATLIITGSNQLDIHGDLTNNGTFTRNTSMVKFLGAAEQVISGSRQTNFWNVHISNTSATGVVMNKSIGVYNEIRLLDGYLIAPTDTVKVENATHGSLSVFSQHSFVVGKITRKISNTGHIPYEFPVGDAANTNRYFRATIRTHNLQGTSSLTVWFDTLQNHSNDQLDDAYIEPPDMSTYYNYNVPKVNITGGDTATTTDYTGYTNAAQFVNWNFTLSKAAADDGFVYTGFMTEGEWQFEPDVQPTGGFYDMILYTANIHGLSDNYFGVLKRPTGSSGRYWSGAGGKMNPFNGSGRMVSDGYAERMMLTTFSGGGAGGGGGGGLPIELLDFSAELIGDQVELSWATATEINNDYFTIEKSDGKDFKQVAIIPGAGNSSATRYYSKIDYEPFKGVSYYRLKQTDYDGKFDYSDVVSVTYEQEVSSEDKNEVVVFPNPSTGQFSLTLKKATEIVDLLIFDAKGNLLRKIQYSAPEDNFVYTVNIKGLQEGIYYVKVDIGKNTIYTKKLMLFEE